MNHEECKRRLQDLNLSREANDKLCLWFGDDEAILEETLQKEKSLGRAQFLKGLQSLADSLRDSGDDVYGLKIEQEHLDWLLAPKALENRWKALDDDKEKKLVRKLAKPKRRRKRRWKEPHETALLKSLESKGFVEHHDERGYRIKSLAFEAYIYYEYNESLWKSLPRERLEAFRSHRRRCKHAWTREIERLRSNPDRLTRLTIILFLVPYILIILSLDVARTEIGTNVVILSYLLAIGVLDILFRQVSAPLVESPFRCLGAYLIMITVVVGITPLFFPSMVRDVINPVIHLINDQLNQLRGILLIVAIEGSLFSFLWGLLRGWGFFRMVKVLGVIGAVTFWLIGIEFMIVLTFTQSSIATLIGLYTLYRARKELNREKGELWCDSKEKKPVLLEFLCSVTQESAWSDWKNWRWPHAALFTTLALLAFLLFLPWLRLDTKTWTCEDVQVTTQYPAWMTARDSVNLYVTLYNNSSTKYVSGNTSLAPKKEEVGTIQIIPTKCDVPCRWGLMPKETVTIEWRILSLELRKNPRNVPIRISVSGCQNQDIEIAHLWFLFGLRGALERQPAPAIFSLIYSVGYALVQMWAGEKISRRLLEREAQPNIAS